MMRHEPVPSSRPQRQLSDRYGLGARSTIPSEGSPRHKESSWINRRWRLLVSSASAILIRYNYDWGRRKGRRPSSKSTCQLWAQQYALTCRETIPPLWLCSHLASFSADSLHSHPTLSRSFLSFVSCIQASLDELNHEWRRFECFPARRASIG